jgi:putative ABC transport system substrate-binding protein
VSRASERRALVAGAAVALAAFLRAAPKVPRVGFLGAPRSEEPKFIGTFEQGLAELGYIDGKNVAIEFRPDAGDPAVAAAHAAELVRLPVDVLVAAVTYRALAARRATAMIPIVMINVADPVEAGLVASLGRPGGNVTGLSRQSLDIAAKGLQLLKEAARGANRVAVLWTSSDGALASRQLDAIKTAATTLGVQLVSVDAKAGAEIDAAFASITAQQAQALLVPPTAVLYLQMHRITELALEARLPSMYGNAEFVRAGGLMSYGADSFEQYRRAAYYVDRILRGTKPADLPVEQPTQFRLTINAKTAATLGLAIESTLLVRADEVIR